MSLCIDPSSPTSSTKIIRSRCHTAGVVPDHGEYQVHELNRDRGPSIQEIMMESQDTRVVLLSLHRRSAAPDIVPAIDDCQVLLPRFVRQVRHSFNTRFHIRVGRSLLLSFHHIHAASNIVSAATNIISAIDDGQVLLHRVARQVRYSFVTQFRIRVGRFFMYITTKSCKLAKQALKRTNHLSQNGLLEAFGSSKFTEFYRTSLHINEKSLHVMIFWCHVM